jgi:hydrogenase maturation protease
VSGARRRVVVVGVGNAYRGDDGVGLAAAGRVRGRVADTVDVLVCEAEPSRLIEAWEGADAAVVVDAVSSGAAPGTLHRHDASVEALPSRAFRSSTHAFGLGEAIELARALGTLPARVVVLGVEGGDFTAGRGLSPPVAAAVERVAEAVLDELAELDRRTEEPCTSAP